MSDGSTAARLGPEGPVRAKGVTVMKRSLDCVLFGLLAAAGRAAAEGVSLAGGTAPAASAGEIGRLLQFAGNAFSGVGAPFMWAILLVSAFAATVTIEKAIFLHRASRGDRDLFDHTARLVKDRRIEEARAVADRSRTPFGRVARSVLGVRHGHRPEELQSLLDEAYLGEIPVVHRRISLLAVAANLATLLGLLGTIVGLIMAFDALANVPAAQRTAALAAGISVAMATTGLGLLVAIPSLAAHGLLGARADRLVEEAESRLAVLTNLLQEWNRTPQADPYEESKTGVRAREERLVDFVVSGDMK